MECWWQQPRVLCKVKPKKERNSSALCVGQIRMEALKWSFQAVQMGKLPECGSRVFWALNVPLSYSSGHSLPTKKWDNLETHSHDLALVPIC